MQSQKSYKLRPKAATDVENIFKYTLQQWGLGQAEFYIRELHNQFVFLAHHPMAGRSYPHLRKDLRGLTFKHHIIFYRPQKQSVLIIRVLHQSMDCPEYLN